MTSRFDGLDNEFLNLKDVIIKNFQVENEYLRKKVNVLESQILTLESDHNSLEQYQQHNNIEITGIPSSASDQNLEEKVLDILMKLVLMYHQKILNYVMMYMYQKLLEENNSSFYK